MTVELKSRKGCTDRREIARQARNDLSLEFVHNAGGGERLQNDIAGRDGCADPHTQTTEGALDVVHSQDPGRDAPRPENSSPRDIHWIDLRS